MTAAFISVILPTYNRADLIGETLESLFAQTRCPDEILVIDDGSTDGTAALLANYGDSLRVLRHDNAGKAVSLNRGLASVRGDLIWIVDDDDILVPDACAHLAHALEADPTLDFCAGRHLDFTHDPVAGAKVLRAPGYMRSSSPGRIFPDLLEGCHIFQPGLMVRSRVYGAVGPFRDDLVRSQDYEMILRLSRHHRGVQLDEVVFWHRDHEGARGQAGNRFSAAQNADRWAAFNARIFSELLADLSDAELFSPAEWSATPVDARPRLARIARATIKARQRMWSEALSDIEVAARLGGGGLSALERALLGRASLSSLGTPELIADTGLHARVRRLRHLGPLGSACRNILRKSIRWQLRRALAQHDLRRSLSITRFFLRT
ncbi:glycosyltransferase family 2 protein [Thioclava indica]|uniref:Glycosyltransferase 2-like domain-containing protein n=1 Tax=Thioclava indica TaxID=1353528 RepID=A0A074JQG9_9RHOB|nr:glycosyltransferase family A protein [Thioclava indica]KEO59886.1 hypothetical protein DT23_15595 [Thioclava indica]